MIMTNSPSSERTSRHELLIEHLQGAPLAGAEEPVQIRGVPFVALPAGRITGPIRVSFHGITVERLFFLGMVNHGMDQGQAHWGAHHSVHPSARSELAVGDAIGAIAIRYDDGSADTVPLVMGFTAWWYRHWWLGRERYPFGPRTKAYPASVLEPFASRPELATVLRTSLRLHEDLAGGHGADDALRHFYLLVEPRPLPIREVELLDNLDKEGCPALCGLTLQSCQALPGGLRLTAARVAEDAVEPGLRLSDGEHQASAWQPRVDALKRALYTQPRDLPADPAVYLPDGFSLPRIVFSGGALGTMLSNLWTANLDDIDRKFLRQTGEWRESRLDSPWYGGYTGIGTWVALGIYHDWVYGRSAEHFATLGLRFIDDGNLRTSFVDYCDRWLYFFRANSDPDKGPPNPPQPGWDPARYPADAPPHWTFVLNAPGGGGRHGPLNDIPGTEEMAGHGSVLIARYLAWRHLGAPAGDWLTQPRREVYGKSRWEATRDACEFIPWLMDYTGMDVIYSEGEETGWGGGRHWEDWPEPGHDKPLLPPGMHAPRDAAHRRWAYANCDAYEVYPATMCLIGLRCGARMAEAAGETELARRWRGYAERIRNAMIRKLTVGDFAHRQWRISPYSVFPSFQDALAPLFAAWYDQGLDPRGLDPRWVEITRNTYYQQRAAAHGLAPVLGMGYGHGWMTQTALMLDELDDAGQLLANLARYSYDKNMEQSPPGQDWRAFQWLIPEGVRLGPSGDWWYRIGDLTNGANQGPPMHALELAAGIDDVNPEQPRLLPRVPANLQGISVRGFPLLTGTGRGQECVRVTYDYVRDSRFCLELDRPVTGLQVRLGPWRAPAGDAVSPLDGLETEWVVSGVDSGRPAHWLWLTFRGDITHVECRFKNESGVLRHCAVVKQSGDSR